MPLLIPPDHAVTEAVLTALAHLPTASLPAVVHPDFERKLDDAALMRLAVLLAKKSDEEGGCPIGAVIRDDDTGRIVGKGHNTLVQEGHPYNHGETAAIRDAGRIDFSRTTLYTSLGPCDVCTALLRMRGFRRVVIGDASSAAESAAANAAVLRAAGIQVDILEDDLGIEIYQAYQRARPDQDLEDWKGLAAVRQR